MDGIYKVTQDRINASVQQTMQGNSSLSPKKQKTIAMEKMELIEDTLNQSLQSKSKLIK